MGGICADRNIKLLVKIRRLEAESGLSQSFKHGRGILQACIKEEADAPNDQLMSGTKSEWILTLLQRHLMGEITAEDLALQLPSRFVAKTPPKISPG